MSDLNNRPNGFREAVCVEAQRIFDSCSEKDYTRYLLKLFKCNS